MFNLINSFLNCICITIPEFGFLIIITLLMMGRKEMLDIYNIKNNFISLMKIIIPSSIILDILNFINILPVVLNKLSSFGCLYVLMVIVLNSENHSYVEYPKLKQKAFGFLMLGILISIVIDMITSPIIFKLAGKSYEEIKTNILLLIICSLSSRIINIIILLYIFINKNNRFQFNLINYIFNNKFFTRLTTSTIIGLVLFELYFIKLITINNLLNIIHTTYEQFFIIIGITFLIPSLIISIVYLCINYCVMIINSEKQTIRND